MFDDKYEPEQDACLQTMCRDFEGLIPASPNTSHACISPKGC